MKKDTKNTFIPFANKLLRLLIVGCLLQYEFSAMQAFAESNGVVSTGNTITKELTDNTQKNIELAEQNKAHDLDAKSKGGLTTQCRTMASYRTEMYNNQLRYRETSFNQGIEGITRKREELRQTGVGLQSAGESFTSADQGTVLPDGVTFEEHKANLKKKWDQAKTNTQSAQAAYSAAAASCPRYSDPAKDRPSCASKVSAAAAALTAARKRESAARTSHERAGSIVSQGQLTSTGQGVETEESSLISSHQVSGCNSNPARSAEVGCTLSGPLFERDEELTNLANHSIGEAIHLAKLQSERVLDLELERAYNTDFELYEVAMADFDDNQLNGKMARSNLEVLGMATAAVKNLNCKKHPLSDADSKAYHLFRAASATYLIASVNETSYYSKTAGDCRSSEEYTADDRDLQLRTVERAANLTNQQMENLCLRISPTDPALSAECKKYLVEILGEENLDKPKTREQALEMYQLALDAAMEELASKREKVSIAHSNVEKGKAWVKSVKMRIMLSLALAAMGFGLSAMFNSIGAACAAAIGCNPAPFFAQAAKWAKYAAYFMLLVTVYFFAELMRAKKFLKMWEKRLWRAKHFTHLICNNSEARSEEAKMIKMGKDAKDTLKIEIEKRKESALKAVLDAVKQKPTTAQATPTSTQDFFQIMTSMFMSKAQATTAITPQVNTVTDDPKRLADSLGVASGSTSFEYFLTKRNYEWQRQGNDVTTKDNFKGAPLISVDQLVLDVSKLDPENNTGFPIPETRINTIQGAITAILTNVDISNLALEELKEQRDAYLQLLDEMRTKLKINKQGLDDIDTTLIPRATGNGCLKNDPSGKILIDEKCECAKNNSCSSFKYPDFKSFAPGAISTKSALKFNGKEELTGQLSRVGLTGGTFGKNANRIDARLKDKVKSLNSTRKKAGLKKRDIAAEARANEDSSLSRLFSNLAKVDPYSDKENGPSSLSSRRSFGLGGTNLAELGQASSFLEKKANKASAKKNLLAKISAIKRGKTNKAGPQATEFSLDGEASGGQDNSDTTQDWENLANSSDESIQGDGLTHNGEASGGQDNSDITQDWENLANSSDESIQGDGLTHKRNLNNFQYKGKNASISSKDGIYHNRKANLFDIISERYEKTAFPILIIDQPKRR